MCEHYFTRLVSKTLDSGLYYKRRGWLGRWLYNDEYRRVQGCSLSIQVVAVKCTECGRLFSMTGNLQARENSGDITHQPLVHRKSLIMQRGD